MVSNLSTYSQNSFGMIMPGRSNPLNMVDAGGHRYGFQGQELDDEIKGGRGSSVNYKYRMHDPRVGRFFAVDPLERSYPWNSPYAFSENRVLDAFELEGLESTVLNSPLAGSPKISSKFLDTRTCSVCSPTHGGTDYDVKTGTTVMATSSGKVVRANRSSTYGNVVVIDHGALEDGITHVYTLYAHNSKLTVEKYQQVETGDPIAISGNTGNSTGPHLHYEVVVTSANPDQDAFYGNLKIRRAPEELAGILKGETVAVKSPPGSSGAKSPQLSNHSVVTHYDDSHTPQVIELEKLSEELKVMNNVRIDLEWERDVEYNGEPFKQGAVQKELDALIKVIAEKQEVLNKKQEAYSEKIAKEN